MELSQIINHINELNQPASNIEQLASSNMSNCSKSLIFLAVALLAGGGMAEARRVVTHSRQQAAAAAPYPAADDLKPEIPFEEGVAATPDQTYGPPDLAYGPPVVAPDQTYGPPTDTVEQLPSDEQPADFVPEPEAEELQPSDEAPARFTARMRQQQLRQLAARRRSQQARPARPQRLLLFNEQAASAALAYVQPLRLLRPAPAQLQLW